MIVDWQDKEALKIWNMQPSTRLPPEIQQRVRQKLILIDAAISLSDSCGGFNTTVLCAVTKGIKADCNHLIRTTTPTQSAEVVDLKSPPSNSLEALKHDRKCPYSIRINSQWRICFEWNNGRVFIVDIVDYH